MSRNLFLLVLNVLSFVPILGQSQTAYTAGNYPKWRAIGGIPAVRVYSVNDTSHSSSSKVNVSTLDAGGFGLSYGIYTHPEVAADGTTITGGLFDVSFDLLFFISTRNSLENITFAPTMAIGLWNNKLEFGIGYDYGHIPDNSSRTFFVVSASQSLYQWK